MNNFNNFSLTSRQPDEVSFGGKILNLFNKLKPDGLRDWKKIIFLFVAIAVVIFSVWAFVAKTSDEVAALSLSPSTSTVAAGEDFNVSIRIDTRGNNVTVVKAETQFNPNDFELRGWSTADSIFGASGNTCVYNNKSCEIITDNSASGNIIVTEARPSPGVNASSGLVATLTFRAKKAIQPTAQNIILHYVAYNNYTDSDVILDDGAGTDILSEVFNATVSASLPVPTGLSATAASATGINLSWNTPSINVGVTGYKIFRYNGQYYEQKGTSATTTYSDTGLTPQTAYQYKISAFDAYGHESALTTAPVSATTMADITAPSVPKDLSSGAIWMDKLGLYWPDSTDDVGVTGYNVYQDGKFIGNTPFSDFGVGSLNPDTSYQFNISAYDEAGNESAKSDTIAVKTLADSQAPTVPTNVSAQAVSISQINLTWSVSTDNVGVTGYNIYRNGSKVGASTAANFQDKGLDVNATYTYRITALDAKNNESEKSSEVSAKTNSDTEKPTVPSNLTVAAASMTAVNLSWSASTDNIGVTGYMIYRNGAQVGISTTTTYQDTGLTKSTPYSYTVLSYDAAGNQSAQTASVSATTPGDTQVPTVPGGLSGTANSMTQITLTWNASTDNIGVSGYRLYRNGTKIKDLAETAYQDTGLTAGTAYTYTVSAYDADGNESAQSSPVSITTLARKYSLPDFTSLVADWLQTKSSSADVSSDGKVNSRDLGIMMHNWE
jgi:chitodextrinase